MDSRTLRSVREALSLTATQLAEAVGCPVEVVLRAEFGIAIPMDPDLRVRIAGAYGLAVREYLRLAFDAAERASGRSTP